MRVLKPRVKHLFRQQVKTLRDAGVELTPEECVWLHHACERTINPNALDVPEFFDPMIRVGDVWLHPLSIQAHIWLEEYPYNWWKGSARMDLWSTAFAMAHSKTSDVFPKMTSRVRASIKVRSWVAKHLFVSRKRLAYACDRLLGEASYVEIETEAERKKKAESVDDENGTLAEDSSEWGSVIALLCSTYNQSPNFFLHGISASSCIALLRKAPLPAGQERSKTNSPEVRAFFALRSIVQEIIRQHAEDKKDKEDV